MLQDPPLSSGTRGMVMNLVPEAEPRPDFMEAALALRARGKCSVRLPASCRSSPGTSQERQCAL